MVADSNKSNIKNGTESKFLKGVTILSVAGIISKVLGAVFRIPLTNLIGAEGMSYYSVAYSIYSYFLILATAGIPVAISSMVSERYAVGDYKNAHKTFKVSLCLMLCLGIMGFSICFFGAEYLANIVKNPGATLSLKAISPVLLLAPVVSSIRGYNQGTQNMIPTATSQVIEQLFRVIVGLGLSFAFADYVEKAAAGATFGASAGSLAALVLLIIIYFTGTSKRNALMATSIEREESAKDLLVRILVIAIPITIGSTITPFMSMIDSFMIMRRLISSGWGQEAAQQLYGIISGYCDPLIGVPLVFATAVAVGMVPAVSEAYAKKEFDVLQYNVRIGTKAMMIVSFPCMVGLFVLAKPILLMLYPYQTEEALLAVTTLRVMTFGVVTFMALRIFSSALQGIGKVIIPVINFACGALLKIVLTYIMVAIPSININGAAFGNVMAYLLTAILNYRAMKKHTGATVEFVPTYVRPFAASVIMGVATAAAYYGLTFIGLSNTVSTVLSILFAVVVYFVTIFKIGAITEDETLALPKGAVLVKIAKKFKLLKG